MSLDTTISGLTSDSYVTLAESNTYFATDSHPLSATWLALTDPQKESYLKLACRDLNVPNYYGCKQNYAQALRFPRVYKLIFLAGSIPQAIKNAQLEQALFLVQDYARQSSPSSLQSAVQAGLSARSLGDLSETYGNAVVRQPGYLPGPLEAIGPRARQYLVGLVCNTSSEKIYNYSELSNLLGEEDVD